MAGTMTEVPSCKLLGQLPTQYEYWQLSLCVSGPYKCHMLVVFFVLNLEQMHEKELSTILECILAGMYIHRIFGTNVN